LLLDARERCRMRLHHLPRLADALRDARRAELLEGLAEVSLAAVERDHLGRVGDAVERVERALRDALRGGLALEARQPGIETARVIAAGGERRSGQHQCQQEGREG
jgi:hypothetical protein